MNKNRRIMSSLALAAGLCMAAPDIGHAQTLAAGYGAPSAIFQVANGTLQMRAKILGNTDACTGGTLQLTLPTGYIYAGGAQRITYTGGIAAAPVNISATTSTATSATLPTGAIPASPDSIIITYNVYAGCGVIGGLGGSVSYALNTPGCSVTASTSTTAGLNAANAVMNITGVSNSAYTGTIGNTYNRVINIQNGGLGTIDTVYLDNLSGAGFVVSGATVSGGGTITTTKTVSGSDTLYRYRIVGPTADGHLVTNETFSITETVTMVNCADLNTDFTAWYGSNATPCTATQGTATAGATVNSALQPALSIVPNTMNTTPCFGGTTGDTLKIVNTGTALAKDIKLNIYSFYWSYLDFLPSTSHVAQSGLAGFSYKVGSAGTATSVTPDSTKSFTTPATDMVAAGAYKGNNYLSIPTSLNPGDTLIVTFNEYLPLSTDCANSEKYHPGIRMNYKYSNACGETTINNNKNILKNYRYLSRGSQGQVDVPSDMWPDETYSAKFEQMTAGMINAGSTLPYPDGSKYIFTFTFPSKSTFSGNVSDFIATNSSGATIPAPSAFNYDAATNTLVVEYTKGNPGIGGSTFIRATMKINGISTDCSKAGTDNNFGMSIGYTLPGCTTQFTGTCYTTPSIVHCPNPCPRGGILPTGVSVRRINFGLPDNDNNGVPDASGVIDMSKVATKRVMHGDTLEVQYRGRVHYGSESLTNFTTGHVQTTWNGATGYTDLVPINAKVAIYNSAGVLIGTQIGLPFNEPTATTAKINYSIAYLSSFPSTYTRYNAGDSIVVTATYRAIQPTISTGALTMRDFTSVNEMFVGNTMAPSIPGDEKYFCDITGGNFSFAKMSMAQNGSTGRIHSGCDSVTISGDNHTGLGLEYAQSESFSHEYRPLSVFDTMKVVIPAGYTFSSATAQNTISNGELSTLTRNASITPYATSGDTLMFNIAALFQPYGGAWHVPDEGHVMNYIVNLKPGCSTAAGSSNYYFFKGQMKASNSTIPTYPFTVSAGGMLYALASNSDITYSKPNIIANSPAANITTATSSAVWEVQIANSVSGITANKVWMAKKLSTGTVTIASVQLLSGAGGTVVSTVSPNANGIYELGDFNGASNKFYRITASFTNCVKDSLVLYNGYSCNDYPAAAHSADCKNELALTVVPQSAGLQVSIVSQPSTAPVQLCDDLNYDIKVINPNLGIARDPSLRVILPSAGGVSYKAGSYKIKVGTAGTFVSLPDAQVSLVGSNMIMNIPDATLLNLNSLDSFRVQFTLNTVACDFVSGSTLRFRGNAINPCGASVNSTVQNSNAIRLLGSSAVNNTYVLKSTAGTLIVTSAYATTPYRFSLKNEGGIGAIPTGEQITVEIPAPLQLDLSTLVNVRNHTILPITTTVAPNGNYLYTWNATPGVAVGDSIVFTANLQVGGGSLSALECGAILPITESVTNSFSSTCSVSPFTICNSKNEIVSHTGTVVNVDRPQYTITGFEIEAGVPADHVIGEFTINHLNTVYAAQNVRISLFNDANANNSFDIGEALIGTTTFPVANVASQTFEFNIPTTFDGEASPILAIASFQYSCDSAFAIATNTVILPVEMGAFTAHAEAGKARLDWNTLSERNSKGFRIEHSTDGNKWVNIGFTVTKAENGNSSDKLSYVFYHSAPVDGLNHYRLALEDLSGSINYSIVRTLRFGGYNQVLVYPNPASNKITVETPDTESTILVYNILGQKIDLPTVKNGLLKLMDVSTLAPGVYTIQVTANGAVSTHKLSVNH